MIISHIAMSNYRGIHHHAKLEMGRLNTLVCWKAVH